MIDYNKKDYGQKLRDYLDRNNISMSMLSQNSGIDKGTLKNIIFGKSSRLPHFEAIADTLHVPIDALITDVENNINTKDLSYIGKLVCDSLQEYDMQNISLYNYLTLISRSHSLLQQNDSPEIVKAYVLGVVDTLNKKY